MQVPCVSPISRSPFLLPAIDFNTDTVGNMRGWECAWTCLLFVTEVLQGNFWGPFGTAINAMTAYILVSEFRSWRAGHTIPARLWPSQLFVLAGIGNGIAWQFFDPTAQLLIGHYLWVASILALAVGYSLRRLPGRPYGCARVGRRLPTRPVKTAELRPAPSLMFCFRFTEEKHQRRAREQAVSANGSISSW